jgi:hypothetical protein
VRLIIIFESEVRRLSEAFLPASLSLELASGSLPKIIALDIFDLNWDREPDSMQEKEDSEGIGMPGASVVKGMRKQQNEERSGGMSSRKLEA